MTKVSKSPLFVGVVCLGIFLTAMTLFSFIPEAKANPSRVQAPTACSTSASGTTSPSYLSAGTATTSITCNMANAGSGTEVFNTAMANLQLTASSTNTRICRRVSYSMDGIDYFPTYALTSELATSSAESLTPGETCFNFASSTEAVIGTATINRRSFNVPVSQRYVKIDFYIPVGSAAGAVWGQLVGKTERE